MATALQGWTRYLKDDRRTLARSAAAERVQAARAKEIELRIAERDGRLIDLREYQDIIRELCGMFRTSLEGLPARLTRDVVFRRKVEVEIDDVFRKIGEKLDAEIAKAEAAAPPPNASAN